MKKLSLLLFALLLNFITVFSQVEAGRQGVFGTYNSSQVQGVWSISNGYQINMGSNNFGNQYGMGYAYSTRAGAPFPNEHQIVFTNNGVVNAAIGLNGNAFFNGNIKANGSYYYGDNKVMFQYTDSWLRINPSNNFQSGIYCGTGLLRTDGQFQVGSGGSKFIVNTNGEVGIGTSSPTSGLKLDVNGAARFGDVNVGGAITLGAIGSTSVIANSASNSVTDLLILLKTLSISNGSKEFLKISEDGNIEAKDHLRLSANKSLSFGSEDSNTGSLNIHNASCCYNTYADIVGNLYFRTEASQATLGIQKDATVTIGVWPKYDNSVADTQGHKLMVNGGILCEKLKVIGDVPNSDYVFESDYDLKSLDEVDEYIKENKHLPEVPSADCFKEEGYNVGEMDDILLRKIEELTLYIIQMNKEMEALKAQVQEEK